MSTSTTQKSYTNLEIVNSQKKNGTPFKFVALRGFATRLEIKQFVKEGETNPTTVATVNIPVNNRNKALNYHLGLNLPISEDETTWLRCSCFDKIADRLVKFMDGRKSCLLDVFGELTSRPYQSKDGQDKISVEIRIYNF